MTHVMLHETFVMSLTSCHLRHVARDSCHDSRCASRDTCHGNAPHVILYAYNDACYVHTTHGMFHETHATAITKNTRHTSQHIFFKHIFFYVMSVVHALSRAAGASNAWWEIRHTYCPKTPQHTLQHSPLHTIEGHNRHTCGPTRLSPHLTATALLTCITGAGSTMGGVDTTGDRGVPKVVSVPESLDTICDFSVGRVVCLLAGAPKFESSSLMRATAEPSSPITHTRVSAAPKCGYSSSTRTAMLTFTSAAAMHGSTSVRLVECCGSAASVVADGARVGRTGAEGLQQAMPLAACAISR